VRKIRNNKKGSEQPVRTHEERADMSSSCGPESIAVIVSAGGGEPKCEKGG